MISKYNKFIIVFLTVISFSFYITPTSSFQFYQLFLYPLTLSVLLLNLIKKRKIQKNIGSLFLTGLVFIIICLLITAVNSNETANFLSGIKNLGEPLMILSLFMFVRKSDLNNDNSELLSVFSKTLITMLVINSIWIFLTMFRDLSAINIYFWGDGDSVAARALTNGRYSGMFNQPMESGTIYSIGIFCWYYLSRRENNIKSFDMITLILLIVGGIMSVSKIFLFIGLPIFALLMLQSKVFYKKLFKIAVWGVVLIFLAKKIGDLWSGTNYLLRFFNSSQNLINLVTAGRFGENSQQGELFSGVASHNWLVGGGFGFSEVYDSLYFYFFSVAGAIGFIFLAIIMGNLMNMWLLSMKKSIYKEESIMLGLMIILLLAGGFGAPILTLNRVSLIVWLMIGIIYKEMYLKNYHAKDAAKSTTKNKNLIVKSQVNEITI